MLKAPKSNSKSVRMTDEVFKYVESQEGKGFNEKFENMVLFAMKTEQDRKNRIAYLDAEIARKQDILQSLQTMDNRLVWVRRSLAGLADQVSGLIDIDDDKM